jgi:ribosomal protein L4
MTSDEYYSLLYYTLSRGDAEFIHQHAVDAHAAQHADDKTKALTVAFALIGLYLYVEKGFTGREVQRAHTQLASRRKQWPAFKLPKQRGTITVADVVDAEAGGPRDHMIGEWCCEVWSTWKESRTQVVDLVATELNIR